MDIRRRGAPHALDPFSITGFEDEIKRLARRAKNNRAAGAEGPHPEDAGSVTRRVTPYPRTECAGNDSAPFSLRGKEKAAGGKKKTPKGDLRRNKLYIPHPAASGRSRPFRCSSFSHANRFAGFAREPLPLWNPLKTTKKRADAPFLDFSQGFGLYKAYFKPPKNAISMRIRKTGEVVEILCGSLDFHTSNIQRALTSRLYTVFRALRKPDSTVARRAFLDRRCNDNT